MTTMQRGTPNSRHSKRWATILLAELIERNSAGTPQCERDAGTDFYPIAQRLLRMGAPVKTRTGVDLPLLRSAAQAKDVRYLKLLLACGLDVNLADNQGMTPLMWSATPVTRANFDLLLASGANIHARDKFGQTVLNHAYGYYGSNEYLLSKMMRLGLTFVDKAKQ